MIEIVKKTLDAVALFAARKDTRYYLNGVLFEMTPGCCRVVATDGHTLAVATVYDDTIAENKSVIVPIDVIARLPKAKTVDFDFSADVVSIRADGVELKTPPIDGRFPQWRRIIPATVSGIAAQFAPDYVARVGKAAKLLGCKLQPHIHHNGGVAPLACPVTFFGRPDFTAILMPLKAAELTWEGAL